MIKDVFGLIYAGEQNVNLRELVLSRSVAALPIGGRYRVIDFVLSNMVNTGIYNVGVVAQRNYNSLMDHLGSGKEWNLSRKSDGLFLLPPYDTAENTGEYRGLCDAVKNSGAYITRAKQQYCLLTGSYTVYTTIYDRMFESHLETGADITILYNVHEYDEDEITFKDLRLHIDENNRVVDLEFNPLKSKSNNVGMDIYLMRKDLLIYLVDDATARGKYNFVEDVLMPNIKKLKINAFLHKGYVGRLHNSECYYKINMDMLKREVQKDLFYTGKQVYTKIKDEVPAKYGSHSKIENSLVANGCIIEGEVKNSVLFRGVYIGKDTVVKNSIIMQDSNIAQECHIENVILDKDVTMRKGHKLIGSENFPVIIKKGATV